MGPIPRVRAVTGADPTRSGPSLLEGQGEAATHREEESAMNTAQINYYQQKLRYEVDSWDLHEALGNGEAIIVVDGRAAEAYAHEHIPGAVNLPHRELSSTSTESLDKSRTYVCYCDGIGCNASTKTALKLLELGFPVRELIGGLDWWKRDGYATAGVDGKPGTQVACGC